MNAVEVITKFTPVVDDVKKIIREARHMNVDGNFMEELNKFANFLADVQCGIIVNSVDAEDYTMDKMLDAMDYIMDNWFENCETEAELSVANSIYDVIHEFYFGE